MSARQRLADLCVLGIAFLAFWQALNAVVGSTALPGPAATLSYLSDFLVTARFLESAAATAMTFAYALVVACGIEALDRSLAGRPPSLRRGRRADPGRDLLDAQDHALSGRAADLRPRDFRKGRVWRAARHPAGGVADHERHPQRAAGLSEVGGRTMNLDRWQTIATVLFPRPCRRWSRTADRVYHHAARGGAGRDVRFQARARAS